MEAFKRFRRHSVVVYVDATKDNAYEQLPPLVAGALKHPKIGTTIPKALILSADQQSVYAKFSYSQLKKTKEYLAASKVVKAALEGDEPAADSTIIPAWHKKNSRTYYLGSFVELQDGKTLVIKRSDGKGNARLKLVDLSAGAVARAKEMEKKRNNVVDEVIEPVVFGVETWVSSTAGKTIEATFVSLDGDTITLKKKGGNVMSFPLSKLSAESQERAKQLAGQ